MNVAYRSGASVLWPMDITVSIEQRLVAEARQVASRRGTTLNQLVQGFLLELVQQDRTDTVAQLQTLWASGVQRSAGRWSREELHERM
ncbi:MAG: hypothetical protein F4X99_06870 [Gammaproteobacteria bacterium]|nr:hypothetical protein [Gammaproteobacteria bacterium]